MKCNYIIYVVLLQLALYLRGTKIGTSNLGRRFLPASVSIYIYILSLLNIYLFIHLSNYIYQSLYLGRWKTDTHEPGCLREYQRYAAGQRCSHCTRCSSLRPDDWQSPAEFQLGGGTTLRRQYGTAPNRPFPSR